jgi:hypothetical protein
MDAPGPEPANTVVDRLPPDLAEKVADEIRTRSGPGTQVRIGDPGDRRAALMRDQRRESDGVIEGPPLTTAPVTGAQARGALVGTVTWGIAGAVLGVLIGLIPMFDMPIGARIGLWALVLAMAGAGAGFVFGGGREPELEGEVRDSSPDVTIAVESDDAAVLEEAHRLMADAEVEVAARARRLARHDHPQDAV